MARARQKRVLLARSCFRGLHERYMAIVCSVDRGLASSLAIWNAMRVGKRKSKSEEERNVLQEEMNRPVCPDQAVTDPPPARTGGGSDHGRGMWQHRFNMAHAYFGSGQVPSANMY